MTQKFKRIAKVIMLMAAVVVSVCLFTPGNVNAAEKFIVGFDASFPPYGSVDENGEYVGFDLDLAQEVCDRNGWTLVKQPIDWNTKDSELNAGNISCIWNGFTMNGREDKYTWSTPYIDNSQVVIVNTDSDINKLTDLKGKRVVVQADSSALAALKGDDATDDNKKLAASMNEIIEVADYNTAFMNLESGMADAVCMDIGVASYKINSSDGKFRMLDDKISSEEYGIGFKKGNTKLRDEVQKTLFSMLEDGTYAKIANDWGLGESTCLSEEDTKYIDGGAVPTADPSKIKKKDAGKKTSGSDSENKVVKAKKTSVINIIKQLSRGMTATLGIFILTLTFSMPLGLLITTIRMSKIKILEWLAKIYISIMRGTPLMLQLLVVFYGPHYLLGIKVPYSYRFYAVIIGFSLNYAAYFAEIFRSGIQSIPVGQREAATVLGYSRAGTFFKIIFPQMVKRIMPPVTNEVITLVKDTSLAFALAYTEMFTVAQQITASQASIMPLFVAGLFYYIFNALVAYIMEFIEKKLDYYR